MSDPVKNAEVEDVLSSIRRLVSEDKRPLQALKPALKNDRLVLTPALRVEEDVATTGAAQEVRPDVAMEENSAVEVGLEDSTPVTSELSEDYDDDPYRFDDEADLDGDTITAELVADEVKDVSQSTPAESKAAKLSEKIAALETVIGEISDEWEPDAAGQDAYAGSKSEAMEWEDDVAADSITNNDMDDAVNTPVDPNLHADMTEVLEVAKNNEAENAFEASDVPAIEAEAVSEGISVDQNDADDVAGFTLDAEDQLMDEEVLREMISEIVQSELQGALGERITRNVRRLVRREIHRALTARDLD